MNFFHKQKKIMEQQLCCFKKYVEIRCNKSTDIEAMIADD